ncbi:hypothetical protein EZJ43_11555 [Pedobacter changchengzhani]|uniref:Uncharacterized protein n=1 Tax=Pedobacter changchengzhani TaxID=2529274 RepID=A0A4R5MJA1_9SPHI|nr:hypothetical protein [Pedobacter changchengzhani]TDG35651.1 hypothetical protein EZJ43_11555 [Pedobacter changchengzhani]
MKNSNDLFGKRIDLKNCQINGGRLAYTASACSSITGNRSDVRTTTYDDHGNVTGGGVTQI